MTLVVAKKKGEVLSLVSDTGISLNGEQLGPDKQIPKLCILDRNLAVGFSGSSDLALRAIRAAPKDGAATYRSVTSHFLEGHRQYDTDFILAFGPPLSKLARISDGEVKQGHTAEWIGDQAAFAAFQEFRQTRKPRLPFMKEMLASGQEDWGHFKPHWPPIRLWRTGQSMEDYEPTAEAFVRHALGEHPVTDACH